MALSTPRRPTDTPLLSAKLSIPAIPPVHATRQRLLDLLTNAARSQLTAVTGPAGSGKTVLASAWARTSLTPGPIAWLTLDQDDNTPAAFWSYVVEALLSNVDGIDLGLRPTMQANSVDRSFLAHLAINLAGLAQPAVLVLDRTELLVNRGIGADLDLLLRYSTPGLRLVVIGRSTRVLPLHRYQLSGELAEIGPDELALLPEEAAEILGQHELSLSEAAIGALYASTGGWVTGVCLNALALHTGGSAAIGPSEPAGYRAVAEFLRTEVLDPQPARTRDLLLRTSIVGEIHPDLADRLTGRYDGRGVLDELVRVNAFVRPLEGSWYHRHDLFREMLHDELTAHHPDLVRRLHGQAARWYAEHGRIAAAMHHAAHVGDWDSAANLAVTRLGVAWLLTASDAEPVRAMPADLPPEQPGAAAALLRAVLALARFDTAAARAAVDQAQEAAARGPEDRRLALRLGIATVRVMLARLSGDLDAAETAVADMDGLWSQLTPADLADQARTRTLVLACLGVVQFWAGRLSAARASLGRAAAATEPGTEYAAHDALAHLAMLELHEGKLYQADKFARESIAVADRAGLRPGSRVGTASAALAAVALMWNDLPAVREHMSRAIAAAGSRHDPPTAAAIALMRARVATGRRDGRRALIAVDTARANTQRWRVYPITQEMIDIAEIGAHLVLGDLAAARRCLAAVPPGANRTLVLGRISAAEGHPERAREVLSDLSPGNARGGTLQYAALTLAELAYGDGDTPAAIRSLREALEYGRPDQRRRPIAEAGPWVSQLLRQHPSLAAEHSWLSPRLGPPEADPDNVVVVVEPLTERENEVLRSLAQAMSTEEIANALYLSVNTVKTHLKSIYRKLGASGRSAAARRARELNLLGESHPDAN